MWTGTREQFFELYRVAANHLKREFPDLKIGGYAGCGFYGLNHPEMKDFYKSFVPYFLEFLKFITTPETAAPLDFFSWHLYTTDPHEIVLHAKFVAEKLRDFGLGAAENIIDEWNYVDWNDPDRWDSMKEMPGAAFVAAAFCLMQTSPIDKAMYYDALPTRRYGGLYYFPSQKVTKTYYAFKAYNELHRLGTAVACVGAESEGVYVCAAKDEVACGAVLVVNRNPVGQSVRLVTTGVDSRPRCWVLDKTRLLAAADVLAEDILSLPPQSVVVLKYVG